MQLGANHSLKLRGFVIFRLFPPNLQKFILHLRMRYSQPFAATQKYAPWRSFQFQSTAWYRWHPVHFVAERHLLVRTSLVQVVPACLLVPCHQTHRGTCTWHRGKQNRFRMEICGRTFCGGSFGV